MLTLLGCPLYDDDCSGQGCAAGFACDRFSQRCVAVTGSPSCVRPDQCAAAETCTPDFLCRPGSCDYHGCVSGYICGVVDGAHACVSRARDAGSEAMAAPDASGNTPPADASTNNPPNDAGLPDASAPDAAVSDAGTNP